MKVLVIEDNPCVMEIEQAFLKTLGCDAEGVPNAESGFRKLQGGDYDLVMTDMRLPGMSGERFYKLVHARLPHLAGRFLFVTGDPYDREFSGFLESRADRVLAKPFTPAELQEAIALALSGKKARAGAPKGGPTGADTQLTKHEAVVPLFKGGCRGILT